MSFIVSKLKSITLNKCPRCHGGDFFVNPNPFKSGFWKMHDKCTKCGQVYMLEPGFYYGAMYASYAINVAIFVTVWVATMFILPEETSVWTTVGIVMGVSVILTPLTFRWSRLLWINFFVRYRAAGSRHAD